MLVSVDEFLPEKVVLFAGIALVSKVRYLLVGQDKKHEKNLKNWLTN